MSEKAGAVIYAKSLSRLCDFYAAVVGIAVVAAEDDHAILESPAWELAIVAIPQAIAASIDIATPPVRREDTPIKLVFNVPSIAAAREAAERLGGALNPADREWLFGQQRVCDGHDPEGNVFQVRQGIH